MIRIENFSEEHLMTKSGDNTSKKLLTARPRSEEVVKTFTPKVGGSVKPNVPTSDATPRTPPPPAKTG